MALFRLCKATRRLRASALSLQLTGPVLSPPIPNPKTPSDSFSQSFTTNLFNSLHTHTHCLPKCIYIQENQNFRTFNSTQLVKNAGISTLGYEKKEENEKKEESKVKGCSWIDLYLPKNLVGYAHLARLDKPIGTWLLAWPCMWYALLFIALVCVNLSERLQLCYVQCGIYVEKIALYYFGCVVCIEKIAGLWCTMCCYMLCTLYSVLHVQYVMYVKNIVSLLCTICHVYRNHCNSAYMCVFFGTVFKTILPFVCCTL